MTDEWSPAGASPLQPPAREGTQHGVSGMVVPHLGPSRDLGLGDHPAFLCVCMCRGIRGQSQHPSSSLQVSLALLEVVVKVVVTSWHTAGSPHGHSTGHAVCRFGQ